MQGITSGPSLDAQIYAMKKAIDLQGQGTLQVMESAKLQTQKTSGAALTGVGQKLDIKG